MSNNQLETSPTHILERYLIPADASRIRCIDERIATDQTNGVQIPGGVYGIVDTIKSILNLTEDKAWEKVIGMKIPVGAHLDDHHGVLGCGYAKKVQEDPKAVGAPGVVFSEERMKRIENLHGDVLHYIGEHKPTHATINYREEFSMNPKDANADGMGIFNYDAWAAKRFFSRLEVTPEEQARMAAHLEDVYRKTVGALSGITTIYTLH